MAPDAYPTDAESRRNIMAAVATGLEKCGFPALAAEQWEVGGYAEHPEFRQIAMNVRNDPAYEAFLLDSAGHSVLGDHSGKSSVTSRIVSRDLTIAEALAEFDERGHLEKALNATFDMTGDKSLSLDIFQYNLFLFAKGWEAEKALRDSERFSKAAESNDLGGQDFYDNDADEYVQLKGVAYGYRALQAEGSRGNHKDEHGVPVVYYQFDDSGAIHVSDDHTKANGAAAERAEMKKTDMWKHAMWA